MRHDISERGRHDFPQHPFIRFLAIFYPLTISSIPCSAIYFYHVSIYFSKPSFLTMDQIILNCLFLILHNIVLFVSNLFNTLTARLQLRNLTSKVNNNSQLRTITFFAVDLKLPTEVLFSH